MKDAISASQNKTVDAIVYLGQELPHKLSHESKIPIFHFPLKDGKNNELSYHVIIATIGYLVLGDKTLVACRQAISRSPTIVIAYLAVYERERFSFDESYTCVRKLNPTLIPEPHLLQSVKEVVKSYW